MYLNMNPRTGWHHAVWDSNLDHVLTAEDAVRSTTTLPPEALRYLTFVMDTLEGDVS